jgi:dethiobiotin synthetase
MLWRKFMGRFDRQVRLFVTGTDTGVGKTVLSLLMMHYFHDMGLDPLYIKPVQTGCRDPYAPDSDSKLIYENVPALRGKDPAEAIAYCFTNPKAPYFAARDEGKEVDPGVINEFVNKRSASHSPIILEGAGGLFVPVCERVLMVDLITILGAKPILAARAGLGTINHTLLSLEALYTRGIEPEGVVLLDGSETPTPADMVSENIEAIEKVTGKKVAGVIGRVTDFSNPPKESYQVFDRLFS